MFLKGRSAETTGRWGDLELLDVEGSKVIIAMRAMCVSCPMGGVTVQSIEQKLRELVSEDIVVEAR